MRKTAVLLIIYIAFAAACGDAGKVPKGILSKEQMKEILIDMNMADAFGRDIAPVDTIPLTDSVRELRVKTYYTQVLVMHKVTVKQFMDSYRFYEGRPDLYEDVLKMMMEDVSKKKAYEDTLEVRRQRVISDSLNKKQKETDSLTRIQQIADSLAGKKTPTADSIKIKAKVKAMADSLAAARKRAGLDSIAQKNRKTLQDSLLKFHKRQQDSMRRLMNKRSAI